MLPDVARYHHHGYDDDYHDYRYYDDRAGIAGCFQGGVGQGVSDDQTETLASVEQTRPTLVLFDPVV